MNRLEELLEKTNYTQEEWNIYKKVEKNCQVEDLQCLLEEMLDDGDLTQDEYDTACENAGYIIEKYNKFLDYDWETAMKDAINYILEEEE